MPIPVGTIDPILGKYNGVVYRPITNDFCHEYEQNVLGFPVKTHVGCASSRCAVEGNCSPVTASAPQSPISPVQPAQAQIIAGIDNMLLFSVVLVAIVIGYIWYKKEGKK